MSASDQLESVLRFFDSKRGVALSEVDASFDDVKSDGLEDAMYNRDDVESLLDTISASVHTAVEGHLKRTVYMNVLLLRQVLEQADAYSVPVDLDLAKIEDSALLEEIENFTRMSAIAAKPTSTRRLESLGDERRKLAEEMAQLREENETLRTRYRQMQQRCTELTREAATSRDALASQASTSEGKAVEVEESSRRVTILSTELARTQAALAEAEAEASKHVLQSKQFVQLKKILERKNQQLQELRERLSKYESDQATEDD